MILKITLPFTLLHQNTRYFLFMERISLKPFIFSDITLKGIKYHCLL